VADQWIGGGSGLLDAVLYGEDYVHAEAWIDGDPLRSAQPFAAPEESSGPDW
jgi:hypothetical protein